MPALRTYLVPSLIVLLSACSTQDYVEAPPVNDSFLLETGESEGPLAVQCEGPDDELQLLGSLCGSDELFLGWSRTDVSGAGMATSVGQDGGAQLIIFNEIERSPDYRDNVASEVVYSAYVVLETSSTPSSSVARLDQWSEGEAVAGGNVITESVVYDSCIGSSWVASGTFTWRNTEITLSWDAAAGC